MSCTCTANNSRRASKNITRKFPFTCDIADIAVAAVAVAFVGNAEERKGIGRRAKSGAIGEVR